VTGGKDCVVPASVAAMDVVPSSRRGGRQNGRPLRSPGSIAGTLVAPSQPLRPVADAPSSAPPRKIRGGRSYSCGGSAGFAPSDWRGPASLTTDRRTIADPA